MVKPLLLVAILAHICVLASSTRNNRKHRSHKRNVQECSKNEIWAQCPDAVCVPKTCDDLGFAIPCIDLNQNGTCPSRPCCICEEGFVRDDRGICIPVKDCPSCGGDPNAQSGSSNNCNRLCSNYYKDDVVCILVFPINGCECKPGFVFDEIKEKCVRPNKCSIPVKCKRKNEVIDLCPTYCPARTCGVYDGNVSCPPPLPFGHPKCPRPTCRCKDGFYRNHLGECVPWRKCPVCRAPNQVYDPCPALCPPRTCNANEALILCQVPPKLGDPECKPGCRCRDGYVKNQAGVCIPKNKCPTSCNGDSNAVPGCGIYCNQRCRDVGKQPGACILSCKLNSCDCRKGYYLDENTGKCVLPRQCTRQCPINEFYSTCTQGNCSPQTCFELDSPLPCPRIDPRFCKKGCLCKEGYVRNKKGVCIPKSDCRPKCPKNEFYSTCIQGNCSPQTCSEVDSPLGCPRIDPSFCKKGCLCKEGYVRNKKGVCIPKSDCRPKCPKNEFYSTCIQGNCSPQTCSEVDSPLGCPRIDPRFCEKGCLCKEGYVRNDKGVCIPSSDCPPTCDGDSNKVPGCGTYCNQRCSDIGNEPRFCIQLCIEGGCDCRKGYYLDDNTGFCVLPEDCSPQCPKNEWYSECIESNCNPENCTQVGFPLACPAVDPDSCTEGCLCKPGFSRNRKGICIPSKQCPSCRGDRNAQAGCGGNCNRHCSNIGQGPVACKFLCELNGCDCKDGFYFDDIIEKCVKPEQCSQSCPLNEVYSDCTNGGCQARNCSEFGKPVRCVKIDPKFCKKGCVCKENYLRASNGQCIPEKDCREACNGLNEEYSECSWNCPPRTCESLDMAYICPIREGEDCKPACRCKPGYFRDRIGQCITEKQCRMCTGPNEIYSCGGPCDNVCATLDEQSQDNCLIRNIKCNEMCYCEEGYARARNNTCIPISCCESDNNMPQCPLNERYEKCPGSNCEPQCCDDVGYSGTCPTQLDDGSCSSKPACVCIDGYVRDKDGKCIPMNQCPSCKGDTKARYGCGVNCGRRCTDLIKPGVCLKICYPNSCDCIEGYYFDANLNKCVLANQCTDICGKNEMFEDCSNPVCRAKNCSQVGFPLDCSEKCVKGCVCKNGFVRNKKGVCISINECPSCGGDHNAKPGCGTNCGKRCPNNNINSKICPRIACIPQLNRCDCKDGFFYDFNTKSCVKFEECSPYCDESNKEEYDPCSNGGCGWKNCTQVGGPILCIDPIKCIKGCKCIEGYYRLDDGTCVPEEQCPKKKCKGPNEYFDCGPVCDNVCGKLESRKNCSIFNIKCQPKCYCKDGFARNSRGICIPIDQCPKKCKGPNEYYDCGPVCDNVCGKPESRKNCPIMNKKCESKCYCKDGFARNSRGICIPIDQCPKKCKGPNEYFDCGPVCDNVCGKLESRKNCSIFNIKCQPKCYCKDGFARNSKGICIPIDQCPKKCKGPNEYFDCGPVCDNVCGKLESRKNCPIKDKKCTSKCYCKDGFARNSRGICIPKDQCPKKCKGPNEFFDCGPVCDNVCGKLDSRKNCSINQIQCESKCYCKDGFARDSRGICIPIDQCPTCDSSSSEEN